MLPSQILDEFITTVRLDLSPTVLRASSTVVPASAMMVSLPPMSSATLVAMPRRRDAASQTRNTRSRRSATAECDGAWWTAARTGWLGVSLAPAAQVGGSRTGGSQVGGDLARWDESSWRILRVFGYGSVDTAQSQAYSRGCCLGMHDTLEVCHEDQGNDDR